MNPLISTAVISYNQEAFIRQTMVGVLSQKLDGIHEVICGDDVSADNTDEVLKSFLSDERVLVLPSDKNIGMHGNWARTIEACNGKYIAICEGDDVWIDPEKLQKQISLLEQHPEASACFTNANIINSDGQIGKYLYVDKEYTKLEAKHFFELNFNPIPTCTIVFRKSCFSRFPEEYYQSPFADWVLHTMLIQHGPFLYLPDVTSSYRQHSGGIWTGIDEEKQLVNKLKAIGIIKLIVARELVSHVRKAQLKQLDKLLYFYRGQKDWSSYFLTWIKLKMLS